MSIKRFDGSNWVDAPTHKRFDGSNWVDAPSVKRFDGSNWIETAKNAVSPNDTMGLYYRYTVPNSSNGYLYYYREDHMTCNKCGKKIFQIQVEIDTAKYQYFYHNADGVATGQTVITQTIFNGLHQPCQQLNPVSGSTYQITKQQFKDKRNAYIASYPDSLYKNMRYHENGSTRDLFNSEGYLVCPWCE